MFFRLHIDNQIWIELVHYNNVKELYNLIDRNREFLSETIDWIDNTHSEEELITSYLVPGLERYIKSNGFQAAVYYGQELVGTIGLSHIDWTTKTTSLGFFLSAEHQGKGIITRCAKEIINYCFDYLFIERIEMQCDVDNSKSAAIANRLGFVREGIIRSSLVSKGKRKDMYMYGLIKSDLNNSENNSSDVEKVKQNFL